MDKKERHEDKPTGSVPRSVRAPLWSEELQADMEKINAELNSESDRSAAILAASLLEWRLRQTIGDRLSVWDENAERLFGTDEIGGQLGFSDQARAAYCLGLIGPNSLHDVHKIGRIRNRFAHHATVRSFDGDERIEKLCKQLRTPELLDTRHGLEPTASTPGMRMRYLFSCSIIGVSLWMVTARHPITFPNPEKDFMIPVW